MNTQDTAQVIKALEKFAFQKYLEKLVHAKMKKVTLHSIFPLTSAANLSDAHNYVLVEDLDKISGLNSGQSQN